ncbi:MAG: FkbM family methyltransferase [Nitrospiraceae bacterium]|nr:MAG: FkbM family methyltransferase [Nitrospiraceae bacterium]
MLSNILKVILGHFIIILIYYPWRLAEKISRINLGASGRSHYHIMKVFRALFNSYFVDISYRNRISKTDLALKLRLDLCQNNQQWFFRLRGGYEEEWLRLISAGLESSEGFLDIGSNIGVYALTMAQAYPEKKVTAIEPLRDNYDLLRHNVSLNSLTNVTAINAAVSSQKSHKIKFFPNPIHDGGGSIIESTSYRTGDVIINAGQYIAGDKDFISEVSVDNVSIDGLIESKSVIKIDVEGAEASVIESGINVFKKGLVDVMVVEVLHETIDKVVALADEFGFDSFAKGSDIPINVGARLDHFVGNIACLRRASLDYDNYRKRIALLR